jgi:hypothetical protein
VAKAEENLMIQSQSISSSDNAVTTNNNAIAPNGTTTAATVIETATTAIHTSSTSGVLVATLPYTMSFFAKANGRSWVALRFAGVTRAWFDVTSGAVGTLSAGVTASITASAQGYYRCVATFTPSATTANIFFRLGDADNSDSYTGDGVSGVNLWGLQVEQRSSVTAYTATTTAPITNYIPVLLTAPINTARFEHNPVTGESLGLEIEEQRTNLQVQSEDFTTSWDVAAASIQSNTLVAPNGTLTADKLVEDTANSWHYVGFFSITPTTATPYTLSCYAKKGEREFVQLYLPSTAFGSSNAGNGAVFNLTTGAIAVQGSALTSASITSVGNGWYRCAITKTSTSTTAFPFVVSVRNAGTFSIAGYTGDGYSGIYIWGAQLEVGAFATSYIPTTTAQVTRSADAASMTGTNFSSWYRADEGTLYAEFQARLGISQGGGILGTSLGIRARKNSSNNYTAVLRDGNARDVSVTPSPALTEGQSIKMAVAYKTNDCAVSGGGQTVATQSTFITPVISSLEIGSSTSAGESAVNNPIKKLAYYPKRLTNAELQGLTTV